MMYLFILEVPIIYNYIYRLVFNSEIGIRWLLEFPERFQSDI